MLLDTHDTIKATPEMPLSEKIPEALSLLAKLPLDQLPETKEFRQIYGSILKWGFGDPVALATSEHYGEALDGYRRFCRLFSPTQPLQTHIALCVSKWIQMALDAEHSEAHLISMRQALFLVCQHCRKANESSLYEVLSMALNLAKANLQGESPFQFARFLLVWDTHTFPERFWVEHSEYRTVTPLAVKVLRRAVKDILTHADAPLAHEYVAILETAIKTHPATATQLITPLWQLLVLAVQPAQACEHLLSLVRSFPTSAWSWFALGDGYAPEDPSLAIACFAKVFSLSPTPSRTLLTRQRLLDALMSKKDAQLYPYAKFEALQVQQSYQERNWGIKPPLLRHLQTLRDVSPASEQEQKAFYQRCVDQADALIL